MSKTDNAKTNGKKPAAKGKAAAASKDKDALEPGFKVDRSKAARAMGRAYAITQERLHGAKGKRA